MYRTYTLFKRICSIKIMKLFLLENKEYNFTHVQFFFSFRLGKILASHFHPTSLLSVLFLVLVDISSAWRAPFGSRLAYVEIWQPLAIGRRSASLYLSLSGFSFCRFGRASIQTAVFSPSISRICFLLSMNSIFRNMFYFVKLASLY